MELIHHFGSALFGEWTFVW